MGNVYIEPRPKGREGDAISHYVVEDHADSELHSAPTQQEAIDWARQQGHSPRWSRAFDISVTKRSPISGGPSNGGLHIVDKALMDLVGELGDQCGVEVAGGRRAAGIEGGDGRGIIDDDQGAAETGVLGGQAGISPAAGGGVGA